MVQFPSGITFKGGDIEVEEGEEKVEEVNVDVGGEEEVEEVEEVDVDVEGEEKVEEADDNW